MQKSILGHCLAVIVLVHCALSRPAADCGQKLYVSGKTRGIESILLYRDDRFGVSGRSTFFSVLLGGDTAMALGLTLTADSDNWMNTCALEVEEWQNKIKDSQSIYVLSEGMYLQSPPFDSAVDSTYDDSVNGPIFHGMTAKLLYAHSGGFYRNYRIYDVSYFQRSGYLVILTEPLDSAVVCDTLKGLLIYRVTPMYSANDSLAARQWLILANQWESYLELPSTENALNVYKVIPQGGHWAPAEQRIRSEVLDSLYENLGLLARQIQCSDRNAVKLAFRLIPVSDGDFTEELEIMLGAFIRVNSRLFLQEYKEHLRIVEESGITFANLGHEFDDLEKAQRRELELRIESLKSVRDNSLRQVREECISRMRE